MGLAAAAAAPIQSPEERLPQAPALQAQTAPPAEHAFIFTV